MKIYLSLSLILLLLILPDSIDSLKPRRKSRKKQQKRLPKLKSKKRPMLEQDFRGFEAFTVADYQKSEKLFETPGEFAEIKKELDSMHQEGSNLQNVINGINVAGSIPIPYFNDIMNFIASTANFIHNLQENTEKDQWPLISDVADRQVFKQKLSDIKAHMKSIEGIVKKVSKPSFPEKDKNTELAVALHGLSLVANFFNEKDSVLRKFPLNSAHLLLTVNGVFQTVVTLAIATNPEAQVCAGLELLDFLHTIINDYRHICVEKRTSLIGSFKYQSKYIRYGYELDSNLWDNEDYFDRLEYKTGFPKDVGAGNCFKTKEKCSLLEERDWSKAGGRKMECGRGQAVSCKTDLVCVKDLISEVILMSKNDTNCAGEYFVSVDKSYSKHFDSFAAPLRMIMERIRYKSKGKADCSDDSPALIVDYKTGRVRLAKHYWKRMG